MDWFLYDDGLRHERFKKNLTESIHFYIPWNHQETIGFPVKSGGIEVN